MSTETHAITPVERMYLDNGKLDAYAWSGGYPVYYLDRRSDVLCPTCAQAILEAVRADALLRALGAFAEDEDGELAAPHLHQMWQSIGWESSRDVPIAHGVHYEGAPLVCEECQAEIESAYGDPDDTSEAD